jgi:hypothetical protein
MNGKSVRLRPLEAIQDGGWVGRVLGSCEVKCLDVSAERREVGRVRGRKFGRAVFKNSQKCEWVGPSHALDTRDICMRVLESSWRKSMT